MVIAHRLSTIKDADQIAVIHKGKLKEVSSSTKCLIQLVAVSGYCLGG